MSVTDPVNNPEQAALELTLAVIEACGETLLKSGPADSLSGERIGTFVSTLHSRITAHLKQLSD